MVCGEVANSDPRDRAVGPALAAGCKNRRSGVSFAAADQRQPYSRSKATIMSTITIKSTSGSIHGGKVQPNRPET
jgi:hypothetical protein